MATSDMPQASGLKLGAYREWFIKPIVDKGLQLSVDTIHLRAEVQVVLVKLEKKRKKKNITNGLLFLQVFKK